MLSPDDVPVIYELQECYENWKNKVKVNKPKYFGDKISKEFRRINRLIGLTNKFHDLRHTFAVRRYLMTRDIYQVMRELGHTKVTTTQMYADFEDTVDIEKEFPSIVNTSNEPNLAKGTQIWGHKQGRYSICLNINNLQHFTSVLSSRRSRVQVSSVPHRE